MFELDTNKITFVDKTGIVRRNTLPTKIILAKIIEGFLWVENFPPK